MGTLDYMAPEQLTGGEVDQQSNIWSVGVMLYEMITGRRPFQAEYDAAVTYAIAHEEPEPLVRYKNGVPEGLQRIIDKALDKDKETRYQNITDLLTDLKWEKKSGSQAVSTLAPQKKSIPKRAIVLTTGITIVAILATLLVINRLQEQRQTSAPLSVRPLTTFDGFEANACWSPDGSQIAFMGTRYSSTDIYTMSIGGGEPHRITQSPYDETTPRWSRDGTKVVFLKDTGNGASIYWCPPTGGMEQKIAETQLPYLQRWEQCPGLPMTKNCSFHAYPVDSY